MNSSRATGAQPQNRHFVHTGSITRRQPPQTFCCFGCAALLRGHGDHDQDEHGSADDQADRAAPVDTCAQLIDLNLKFVLPSVIMSLSTSSCFWTCCR